jgi:hypothetical protein
MAKKQKEKQIITTTRKMMLGFAEVKTLVDVKPEAIADQLLKTAGNISKAKTLATEQVDLLRREKVESTEMMAHSYKITLFADAAKLLEVMGECKQICQQKK